MVGALSMPSTGHEATESGMKIVLGQFYPQSAEYYYLCRLATGEGAAEADICLSPQRTMVIFAEDREL